MSKELIERLREAALLLTGEGSFISATDLGAAASRIELLEVELERERMRLAACGVVAMSDTQGSAAKARDMREEYRSASCDDVARRVDECISLRAERDALAAELKALREQEPVAWGDEPWMASFGVRVGRDSSNSIDLIFTTVGQRKFQLYAHEAAYLRGLLNKAEIPGYPNTHPAPARELTDADIALCIASADKSFAQERISGKPVLGVWSKHLARAIERHLKGEGE